MFEGEAVLPDYPALFWACAVIAVLMIGIAKAGVGSGVGVIGTPLMALTIPVGDAVALLLPLLILCDVFSVWHYRSRFHRRSVALLLPGAVAGVVAGTAFFGYFLDNQHILKMGVGVVALLFVLYQLVRALAMGALERHRPRAPEGVIMGAVAGFTSTLAHAGGPPVAIYLLPQRLPRDLYVGTTVIFFATLNLIKLGPYWSLGLIHVGNLAAIALLSPLTYVGVRLGIFLNRRFSDRWFNRAVYAILFATGVHLLTE
jgi:uncharacterized membrane protein YfcA